MELPERLDNDTVKLTYLVGHVTRSEASAVERIIHLTGMASLTGIEGTVKLPNGRRTMPRVLSDLKTALAAHPDFGIVFELFEAVSAKLMAPYYCRNHLVHSNWIADIDGLSTGARFFRLDESPKRDIAEFIQLADDFEIAVDMLIRSSFVISGAQTDAADRRAGFEPESSEVRDLIQSDLREWAAI